MTSLVENSFFEGTEKLLEIWFASEDSAADLRKVSRQQLDSILNNVHCQILSVKGDETMKAYLLSESSLFVSKNRFILKTCGKTTLLAAVDPLLKLAKDQCGFDKIVDVFYSRKNFLRPELQHSMHQNFDKEVEQLDELFEDGAAYALGRINRDCWYLYTIDYIGVAEPDQTLELLMQGMSADSMKLFSKEHSSSAQMATLKSGIADLIPGTLIDDHLFDPCGYSMNGVLPQGQYFTIHITPEPQFSYCSFETNVPKDSYHLLILKVLDIFKPKKFLMTLFANEGSMAEEVHKELHEFDVLLGYHRADHQYCQLKNYNLTYTMYQSTHDTPDPQLH